MSDSLVRDLSRKIRLAYSHGPLLAISFILVVIVRITLSFRGHAPILAEIRRIQNRGLLSSQKHTVASIVWAVRHTSRLVPKATCLTQSLVVRLLLARSGHDSKIRIGVSNSDDGKFEAHAWVIYDGLIVIGGSDDSVSRYKPMVDL